MPSKIDAAEFTQRLEALCARGSGREWPRKQPDQHVLLKSVTLQLDAQHDYDEKELNARLAAWCNEVGRAMATDHVALRRYLVDAGYLQRDAAGRNYRVNAEKAAELFEPAVDRVDPTAIVAEARRRVEERKRAFIEKR